MPTVEADVAFGLGKFNPTQDEIKSRVATALDVVGTYVGVLASMLLTIFEEYLKSCSNSIDIHLSVHFLETCSNSEWWSKTTGGHCRCFGRSVQSTFTG